MVNGSEVYGSLFEESPGQLVSREGGAETSVPYSFLESIVFPEQDGPSAHERRGARVEVWLRDGSRLGGGGLVFHRDSVMFSFSESLDVRVSADVVSEIVFRSEASGLALRNRINTWGAYSDRDEEYPRTLEALREELDEGWEIVEDFESTFGPEFLEQAARSRALLL